MENWNRVVQMAHFVANRCHTPARVVVGEPYGSDVVNRLTEPVQAQVIEGLGLGQLANLL
jgi:hypothetical protein